MTISRRLLLQASAMTPIAAWLPWEAAAANSLAESVPDSGAIIESTEASGLVGVALDWPGPDPGDTVARVLPLVGNVWQEPIEVESDHGHGPPDPTGRIHSPAILVPGAKAFRVVPTGAASNLRLTRIPDSPGPLSAAGISAEGYSTVEPIQGLSIIERSNWTDRQRHATPDCWIGSSIDGLGCRADVGIRHGVVHHTVNINCYQPNDVPAMLRGIQRYHMDTRGWDDIGYNFVVDRFGRIWHARSGTISGSVSGAHTSGLNTESVGVAVLGTFTQTDPGQPVIDALSALLGWKLSRYGVDPLGQTIVRSAGGDYAEPGEMVLVNNVSGHRENQQTSCPGSVLFGRIPEVRSAAAELVPVFGHLVPDYGPTEIGISGWAIDRFMPSATVPVEVTVDNLPPVPVVADAPLPALSSQYPTAGAPHGFEMRVPIDLDTRSVVVTATAGDGRSAMLMDLHLFATFIDVEPTKYFADGIYWLRANDLTSGTQPGLFEPVDEVSRIQMAAFLWRLWDRPPPSAPSQFVDVPANHPLADSVSWLAETHITQGTSLTTFSPERFLTRGEMATLIWRMCGTPAATQPSPFRDVPESSYFSDAARWMQEVGVTVGTTSDTFSPDALITRGEMATFLHRLAMSPDAWALVTPPRVVADTLASV